MKHNMKKMMKGKMHGGGVSGPMAMNSMRRASGFPAKPNVPKMGKRRGGKKR